MEAMAMHQAHILDLESFENSIANLLSTPSTTTDRAHREWLRQSWGYCQDAHLALSYDDLSWFAANIHAAAFGLIYSSFCEIAFESRNEPDWLSLPYDLQMSLFKLGGIASSLNHQIDEIDDEDFEEGLPNAIQSLVIRSIPSVADSIAKGFGGNFELFKSLATLFCHTNECELQETVNLEHIKGHWRTSCELARDDHEDPLARVILWVDAGMPNVDPYRDPGSVRVFYRVDKPTPLIKPDVQRARRAGLPSPIEVYADDKLRFMNLDDTAYLGSFDDYEDALLACKRVIDKDFQSSLDSGATTASRLLEGYRTSGYAPRMMGVDNPLLAFDADSYASERAHQLAP